MSEWFDEDNQKRKVCANCKETYIEGDKYCRFCGAPMGKPDYIVDTFGCIYGPPPVERVHRCKKCGYQWTTDEDKECWCPKCGGSAPAVLGEGIILNIKYKEPDGWVHCQIKVSEDRDAIIGRSPGCDIIVNDMHISRKQFRILMKGSASQSVYVENLGSTNPAYINERPFTGIMPLKNGDELCTGNVSFLIYFSRD